MHPIHISFTSKILLALAGIRHVAGDFSYPSAEGVVFRAGESRTIRFETKWEEYSIALWQQEEDGKSASLGPILIATQDGAGRKAFEWDVETYSLDLDDSSTFFFWVFQGDKSNQGDRSKSSMASPYFEIKDGERGGEKHGESTRVDPKPMLSSSSSLLLVSQTFLSEESAAIDAVATPAAANTIVDPSISGTAAIATPSPSGDFAAKGLAPVAPETSDRTASSSPTSNAPAQSTEETGGSASEMSVATKAGIGVGAGIGGAALISGLVFVVAKYAKTGRSRARTAIPSAMLFWCRGRQSGESPGAQQ